MKKSLIAIGLAFALMVGLLPALPAIPAIPALQLEANAAEATQPTLVRVGYYQGDSSFQDGFSDEARKSGYAYDYLQQLAPYANWTYEYVYGTRTDAIEALQRGEIDLVAGVYKTPRLENTMLFSDFSLGLEGQPRYFAVSTSRPDLLATLNEANSEMLTDEPKFQLSIWQKYYGENHVVTALSNEEYAWLSKRGTLRLGYLTNNLPISGQDSNSEVAGVIGAVLPTLKEYLRVPIETKAFSNRDTLHDALLAGEVDVAFPAYSDQWTSESRGFFQTNPLVEDKVMIAYTGDYNDNILQRVAVNKAGIAQQAYMQEYDPSAEVIEYPTRQAAFDAVLNGEATCTIGGASIMQVFIAEHSDYRNFSTAYLDESEGFSFAIARDDAMLAVIMQDATQQVSSALVTNALIRSSSAHVPWSFSEVLQRFSLEFFIVGVLIIAVIIVVFIQYRRRVTIFNKEQAATRVALEEALNAADNANAAKTDFLSNMSHDIRTPLNAVIGMTDIAKTNIDDRTRVIDCLNKIGSSGKHLLGIINEILDVSKIESGRFELAEEPFTLSEMLENLTVINKPQADAKRQTLSVSTINLVHNYVVGDVTRLEQVLTNLVSNAIKYTQTGGKIEVSLCEKATKGQFAHYEIVVKDNGKGMSAEYLPHLFEAFTREKDRRVWREQGTGLGMPIALSIARAMNGDIQVESEPGLGSTFTVTVFLRIGASVMADHKDQGTVASPDQVDLTGKRALLAEDNDLNAEVVNAFLGMVGLEIERAVDGDEAVEMVKSHEPGYYDCIFMDMQMPKMDGLEATRAIRALDREDTNFDNLPIFAMTANAFVDDRRKSREAGMNDHFAKPLDFKVVLATVNECLNGHCGCRIELEE